MRPALACFITPHGFGHAARACAVLEALTERLPALRLELFTTVPEWFLAESLRAPFGLHLLRCDLGLVQRSSLDEDLDATLVELDRFLPFPDPLVDGLAARVLALGCRAVLADIAPLGIAVAARAGLPAALVENFTWDWIYEGYLDVRPEFAGPIAELAGWFARADLVVETTPACAPRPRGVTVDPVARAARHPREQVRRLLGAGDRPVVLFTMGGVPWQFSSLEPLAADRRALFVVPGAAERTEVRGSLLALPHHAGFHHPDLVAAADLVVAKLGYSTVAEAWCAGTPLLYVGRPAFRESPVLARFVERTLPCREITAAELDSSAWLAHLDQILAAGRAEPRRSGAAAAAAAIAPLLA